ncbi:MAG: hypothetical protein LAT76_01265, partial [Schleiferiaceae bacterium]|nr:hypothetical protein [Schleiferiaceae bacterium]
LAYEVIRYMGKLPGKASHFTKMDAKFDEEYKKIAAAHQLEFYYEKEGKVYFMFSRIAPSIKVKRVGLGGYLERDATGEITVYKEVFRTWKMEEPVLAEKGLKLFSLMVNNKDLTPFYPENSGREEFIEFPDAYTHFDVEKRMWISSREDVLEPFYHLKGHPEQLENTDSL